jgi:hypothetical protein
MPFDEAKLGRAGEYLVCADLLLRDYNAFICDSGLPYDVLVEDGNNLIKIQVKTTSKLITHRSEQSPFYLFHVRRMGKGGRKSYTNDVIDIIALVAIDVKQIAYIPIADAKKSMSFRSETLKGQYRGEKDKKLEILKLKEDGFTYKQTAEKLEMDDKYVWRVYHGQEQKHVLGRYITDFPFEKARAK